VVSLFLDSGVRRGTDVLKAMALGATAVLLGKPIFFGLAVGGEEGVRRVVEILRRETEVAMILCGCSDLGKVGRGLVREGGRGSYIRPSRL
jgi:(S)-2-hydroxy-acid oxidase